jgi:hypothetical protein
MTLDEARASIHEAVIYHRPRTGFIAVTDEQRRNDAIRGGVACVIESVGMTDVIVRISPVECSACDPADLTLAGGEPQ